MVQLCLPLPSLTFAKGANWPPSDLTQVSCVTKDSFVVQFSSSCRGFLSPGIFIFFALNFFLCSSQLVEQADWISRASKFRLSLSLSSAFTGGEKSVSEFINMGVLAGVGFVKPLMWQVFFFLVQCLC